MIEIPHLAYIKANELLATLPCPFEQVYNVPKERGVYLINKTNEEGSKTIYVGESKDLSDRLRAHYSGEWRDSTSNLRRKLKSGYGIEIGPEMREWISKNCEFSFVKIEDSDLCHFVEKAVILHLRKKGEPLLND